MNQRLVNCDFFTKGNLSSQCSNKAKLLYFMFLVNADDMGFVGNAKEIAENLDRCENDHENTLFTIKYENAIDELASRRLIFVFLDKCGNEICLIKHWFMHNKYQKFLTTNYQSLLEQVEIVKGEYQKKPLEENTKEIKENKTNKLNHSNINESKTNKVVDDTKWNKLLDDIGS